MLNDCLHMEKRTTCSYGNGQPLYTEPYHDVSKPTSYVKRTNEIFPIL